MEDIHVHISLNHTELLTGIYLLFFPVCSKVNDDSLDVDVLYLCRCHAPRSS
jgi:hypothetical protein